MRVFKLFNSVFSSFSRTSVASLLPSIAFGIRSFSPRTSSPIRLDSSSRLRLAVFSSPITFSTSDKALSKRSVLATSEAFRVSVSWESWSRSAKAFSKEASIAALSASS